MHSVFSIILRRVILSIFFLVKHLGSKCIYKSCCSILPILISLGIAFSEGAAVSFACCFLIILSLASNISIHLFRDFISLSFASICFFKRTANLSNRLRLILEKNTNRHDCISIEVVKAIC